MRWPDTPHVRTRRERDRPPLPSDGRLWAVHGYGQVLRGSDGRTRVELLVSRLRARSFERLDKSLQFSKLVEPHTERRVPVSLDVFARTDMGTVFPSGSSMGIRLLSSSRSDQENSDEIEGAHGFLAQSQSVPGPRGFARPPGTGSGSVK